MSIIRPAKLALVASQTTSTAAVDCACAPGMTGRDSNRDTRTPRRAAVAELVLIATTFLPRLRQGSLNGGDRRLILVNLSADVDGPEGPYCEDIGPCA